MTDEGIVRALTRSALSHLIGRVMECENLEMPEAMRIVYATKLFADINDPETGLYREGPVYLYDMLCEERATKRESVV